MREETCKIRYHEYPIYVLRSSAEKRDAIGRCFERLLQALEADPREYPTASDGSQDPEPAQESLLWTMFFMAAHYDKLGHTRTPASLPSEGITVLAGKLCASEHQYWLGSRYLVLSRDVMVCRASLDAFHGL